MANAAFQCITNKWQHREMPLVTTYYFAILLQMKKKEEICFCCIQSLYNFPTYVRAFRIALKKFEMGHFI